MSRLWSWFLPPATPPPPPLLLDEPWRKINWGDKRTDLQYVKVYRPHTEGQQLRILLHGPAGAGKPSLINSVQSVVRGRMYRQALVDNTFGDALTRKYQTYTIQKGNPGTFYPSVFSDIMGLEPTKGVLVDDVILAMKGHVKDGYRFDLESKLSEHGPFYNRSPNLNDQVHVLVCVVPASTVAQMPADVVKKIRDIRKESKDLLITVHPGIIELCPAALRSMTTDKSSCRLMETFSTDVGIPMNCIFPEKNYHEETNLDDGMDSLILSTMRYDDCIDFRTQSKCSEQKCRDQQGF